MVAHTPGHIGCSAPEFDIPKSMLEDYLEEGFTIEEISCTPSVSQKNYRIYRRMERCGLRALNFSNIFDDEFGTWRKWWKISLFVENKCWIFFTKKEASKECHGNTDFRPQTPKTQTPKLQTLCNVFMVTQCSKETAKKKQDILISPPVYRCRIDQTVKI